MKYEITVPITEDKVINKTISVRWDAKYETLTNRIIETINSSVRELVNVTKYEYEKPNLWTNGCFPKIWICTDNGIIDVFVKREDGMWIFY